MSKVLVGPLRQPQSTLPHIRNSLSTIHNSETPKALKTLSSLP